MIKDCLNQKDYKDDELFEYYDKEYDEHLCSDGSEQKARDYNQLIYKPIVSFVDIGCGDGLFIKEFINLTKVKKVVGTDISMPLLKKALKNNPKVKFYRADSKALPFKNNEFGLASLIDVLEHVKSPEKTLQEASRVASQILIKVPLEDCLFINLYKLFVNVDWRDIQGHINKWNSKTFEEFLNNNKINIINHIVPKAKLIKQPNWKLYIMNVIQCLVDFLPDNIKTKIAPSEYYCIVEPISI